MKKAYTFRLEPTLVNLLDNFDGTRTSNLSNAIQLYCNGNDNSNTSYIHHLEDEVNYLRNQNNALMVSKLPLLARVIQKIRG